MPKQFCPECGQPNVYGDVKPKFCGFCQSSLNIEVTNSSNGSLSRSASRKRIPIGRKSIKVSDYDDDDDNSEDDDFQSDGTIPNIRKLDVEIQFDEPYKETVGQVWGSGGGGGPVRQTPKKVNKKTVLANFRDRIYKRTNLGLNENE